jgi:hypothetical protein
MLLGDTHLRLSDECARQARAWLARAVAPAVGAFGLIPPTRGGGPGVRVSHEQGADRLTVHLHALTGLAPDGSALAFDEEAYPQLTGVLSATVELERNPPRPVRLAVLVEPADSRGQSEEGRIEVGEPDAQEDPPRRPLETMALRLRIEPGAVSKRSSLKVAEYTWDGVEVRPSSDHLPACLTVAAWPELGKMAADIRREIERQRELLTRAAGLDSDPETTLLAGVLVAWLASLAAVEDGIPAASTEAHPHAVWATSLRVLRIGRTLLSARRAALEHVLKTFVQPGKLTSGNPHFFEELESYLERAYDHDGLGPCLGQGLALLQGLRESVEYLLGSVPESKEPQVETDVYYYREKKYRLARYGARVFELDEAWHTCFVRELSISDPKSLLLVCDASLLEQNPRPNAGLWMIDKHERVKANMFRVNVDNQTDPARVVALFSEIGEPTVTSVSIASRGLLDFSGLGADPDDRLRIYYET